MKHYKHSGRLTSKEVAHILTALLAYALAMRLLFVEGMNVLLRSRNVRIVMVATVLAATPAALQRDVDWTTVFRGAVDAEDAAPGPLELNERREYMEFLEREAQNLNADTKRALPCDVTAEMLDSLVSLRPHQHRDGLADISSRFGVSVEQAGALLQMSRATAYRHWKYARAWLKSRLATEE